MEENRQKSISMRMETTPSNYANYLVKNLHSRGDFETIYL